MRYESQQETNSGVTSYRITDKDYDSRIATSYNEQNARLVTSSLNGRAFLENLQKISAIRANRWHGGDFHQWSGLEWAGAMCGEAGEVANVCKKLRRIECEIDGNAFSERKLDKVSLIDALAGELADTLIYLVLVAERYDIGLEDAVREKFNMKSVEMGFPERI